MTRPWAGVDRAETPDGVLELRRRADDDFLICLDGRVLMSSRAHRSETALARLACAARPARPDPHVLLGGLGMGFTLGAALAALPPASRVVVAELHPVVLGWCRGPLAPLNAHPLDDPRVAVQIADVAELVDAAARPGGGRYDAILFDLYEGPHARTPDDDPLYGARAIARTVRALRPRGVFAVWSEAPDRRFERRLAAAGLAVTLHRPGRGGRRHAVYVARKPA